MSVLLILENLKSKKLRRSSLVWGSYKPPTAPPSHSQVEAADSRRYVVMFFRNFLVPDVRCEDVAWIYSMSPTVQIRGRLVWTQLRNSGSAGRQFRNNVDDWLSKTSRKFKETFGIHIWNDTNTDLISLTLTNVASAALTPAQRRCRIILADRTRHLNKNGGAWHSNWFCRVVRWMPEGLKTATYCVDSKYYFVWTYVNLKFAWPRYGKEV
jgi:hypothetical protein